ncbi:MAG: hypothetical protein M5U13_01135 [Thermoanaerobaculia bacterium]|nr:hypothetical protein [Thermoanaerobaculia bacterium]
MVVLGRIERVVMPVRRRGREADREPVVEVPLTRQVQADADRCEGRNGAAEKQRDGDPGAHPGAKHRGSLPSAAPDMSTSGSPAARKHAIGIRLGFLSE